MIIIFFHSLLFIYILYLNGFIFLKNILKIKESYNFYEISLIGLVVIIIIAQFLNFFIPLSDNLLIFNIILVTFYFLYFNKILLKSLNINFKIFLLLGLVSLSNIYGSGYSDDINHYHYSYIANTDVSNFIWGSSFLHPLYGTAPSWLTVHSYLNFDQFRLQDIHVLNGMIFFLVLGCLFSELYSSNKKKIYFPVLFSIIMFVLLKYTRLKEFGIDRPSTLFFCFLIFYYLKYFIKPQKEQIIKNFIIISLVSLTIFSIKVIYLPVLFFPLVIFFKNRLILLKKDFSYLIILLPILLILMKNLLGSGCLIFPLASSCIEYLSWSNPEGAKDLSVSAEIFNKSWHSYAGIFSEKEFIQNFNWFYTWFLRVKVEILEIFLTLFLIILITFFSFKLKFKKIFFNEGFTKDFRIILLLIIILSLLIFFLKNPVIRMNHFLAISLMIFIISSIFIFNIKKYNKNFITAFLIIGLIFNLSKNLQRISKNDFINNPYSMINEKVFKQEKNSIDGFTYYVGWYGEAPIAASPLVRKNYKKILIFDVLY